MQKRRKRLGELLLERGLIKSEELTAALQLQEKNGKKLGEILIEQGWVDADEVVGVLGEQLVVKAIKLSQSGIDRKAALTISAELAERHKLIPFAWQGDKLCVALGNPADFFALDDVRMASGHEVKAFLALEGEIATAIAQCYGVTELVEKAVGQLRQKERPASVEVKNVEEAPIISIVDSLLSQAIKERASDIHVEPLGVQVRVRFRVDGLLREVLTFPQHVHAALLSRIKLISGLNIAERRVPQDGRLLFNEREREVDVRVSILPTIRGEKAVLRILDREAAILRIEELGFSAVNLARYRRLYENSCGMILVTGPTGSGKTTTLYATLNELNDDVNNIVTVEDPVEYLLQGINQVQVGLKAGVTFAAALRSILRQDPNIIMVGEIRDAETADIAIRAALTGHLVISTLHTNDAAGAIIRLLEMGIEPFLIASAVKGVIAQRLVRTLCPECRMSSDSSADIMETMFLRKTGVAGGRFFKGGGCGLCKQSGFKGRMAIQEVLPVDDVMRREICRASSGHELFAAAIGRGMLTMAQDGAEKAALGLTTLGEVMRAAYCELAEV